MRSRPCCSSLQPVLFLAATVQDLSPRTAPHTACNVTALREEPPISRNRIHHRACERRSNPRCDSYAMLPRHCIVLTTNKSGHGLPPYRCGRVNLRRRLEDSCGSRRHAASSLRELRFDVGAWRIVSVRAHWTRWALALRALVRSFVNARRTFRSPGRLWLPRCGPMECLQRGLSRTRTTRSV
jgi:hypothetical protein